MRREFASFFKNQNIGAGAARNEGIKKSTGEAQVAFLDADDLWKSHRTKYTNKLYDRK